MNWTAELIVSFTSIAAILIVGVILSGQIRKQKDIIDSMYKLNKMFDPDKIEKYVNFLERVAKKESEEQYKAQLDIEINKSIEYTSKRFQETNKEFLDAWNELANIPLNIMLKMNSEEREKHIKFYPKNEEYFRNFLAAIERGEIEIPKKEKNI